MIQRLMETLSKSLPGEWIVHERAPASLGSLRSRTCGITPGATHAHQGILLLNHESGLAGAAFAPAGGAALPRLRLRASRRTLGLAELVNLVARGALLPARRTLVPANANQWPPLQHNETTLAHASSAQTVFAAVPVTSCEATRCAAAFTPRVHLVGTCAFPSSSRTAVWSNAHQRFPFFYHEARLADAAFSSANLRASFRT